VSSEESLSSLEEADDVTDVDLDGEVDIGGLASVAEGGALGLDTVVCAWPSPLSLTTGVSEQLVSRATATISAGICRPTALPRLSPEHGLTGLQDPVGSRSTYRGVRT
jgi:hypothetical protein